MQIFINNYKTKLSFQNKKMSNLNPKTIMKEAGVDGLVLDDLLDEIVKCPPKEILESHIKQYTNRLDEMKNRRVDSEIITAYRSLLKEVIRTHYPK